MFDLWHDTVTKKNSWFDKNMTSKAKIKQINQIFLDTKDICNLLSVYSCSFYLKGRVSILADTGVGS